MSKVRQKPEHWRKEWNAIKDKVNSIKLPSSGFLLLLIIGEHEATYNVIDYPI